MSIIYLNVNVNTIGYKELDLYDYVEVRTSTITTSNPRLNRLASSSIRLQYFDKWPACLPTFLGISQEKQPHPRGSLLQISKVGTSRDLVDLVEVWVTISRIRGVIYLNLFSWSVQFSWHSIDTKSHFSFLRLLLCLIKYNFKFYSVSHYLSSLS